MKKLLLVIALLLTPTVGWAQCSGQFPNNTVCGNVSGVNNFPRSVPMASVIASSLGIKTPVDLATTVNISLSGDQTIDGTLLSSLPCWSTNSCRVLVKNQTVASQNGPCYTPAVGAWARCTDANTTGQIVQGTQIYVNQGIVNAAQTFVVTTTNPITIGSTSISFSCAITMNRINVACLGADPTGATSNFDTYYLQALALAQTTRASIYIPCGRYKWLIPIVITGSNNTGGSIVTEGGGPGCTILSPDYAAGNYFSIGDDAHSAYDTQSYIFKNFTISPNVTQTSGCAFDAHNAKYLFFDTIETKAVRQGYCFGVGATKTNDVVYVQIINSFGGPNANSTDLGYIQIDSGSTLMVRNNQGQNWNGNGLARFIVHTNTSWNWDGLDVDGGTFEQWREYLHIEGKGAGNIRWRNTSMDRFDTAMTIAPASSSFAQHIIISNNHFLASVAGTGPTLTMSQGIVIAPTGTGVAYDINISGNNFVQIGGNVLSTATAGVTGVLFSSNTIDDSGNGGSTGVAQPLIAWGASDGSIVSNHASFNAYPPGLPAVPYSWLISWSGASSPNRFSGGNGYAQAANTSNNSETGTK